MTRTDAGLDFWLRYVEATGGLTESRRDATLVILPTVLQKRFELPEDLRVTADPDVAREDGATLLSAGHPALARSADDVLAVGDVAAMVIPVPGVLPPSAENLQAVARDQFTVGHGRIDVTGAPTRSVRPILRIGALINYALSTDEHYQEATECWVDVQSQRQLSTPVSMKLAALPADPHDGSPSLTGLVEAIGFADRIIEKRAGRRRSELGDGVDTARDRELGRVNAYYDDALATIERRRAQAPADRQELLDARANSVRNERARRIEETKAKYQATHEVRPYRLYLYQVPVWRLPVDVRRGDRRYPLTLDWLIPLNRFSDIGCPHCGADRRLVATKVRLGCAGCAPQPPARLVPEPVRPPAAPTAATKQVVAQRQTQKKPPMPVRSEPGPPPVNVGKLGEKLIAKVWDGVVRNDRRLARLCAPDSPAAAAIRLYGPSGAARAVGIPAAENLVAVSANPTPSSARQHHTSIGYLDTAAGQTFPFVLRWQATAGTGQIDEILPYDRSFEPGRLHRWVLGPGHTAVHAPPQPRVPLGPVGELLWRHVIPPFGLPAVLRCLAALWRLPDETIILASHGPAATAAGLQRMVCQRANLTTGRFADIAAAYRVEEAAVRAADADILKYLRLGPQRWW